MTEKELDQMADDGCPHVEVPMSAEKIIADPATFIARSVDPRTYCLFVPFTPTILRHMIGKEFCVSIDPFRQDGCDGSLIETQCKEDFVALRNRFYPFEEQCYGEAEGETNS